MRLFTVLSRQPATAWIVRRHLLLLLLATVGVVVITPRFVLLGHHIIQRVVLSADVGKPDLSEWPYVPSIVLPLIACALVGLFLDVRRRLTLLVVVSALLGMLYGYLDLFSVVPFAVFVVLAFSLVKLPVGRFLAASAMALLSIGFMLACHAWYPGSTIAALASFQSALLPMLWYSVYEETRPRRQLGLGRFVLYLYTRFFPGPVLTYRDVFADVPDSHLSGVRLGGMKAIYIALLASIAEWSAGVVSRDLALDGATGLTLLLLSYAEYLEYYCGIVVRFNLVIGTLRLFGIPVRDNFNYWLLARTPNEHWQRWNVLLREWIVTFVFFPIMRARRWLFAAIMASLVVSGLLHVIPTTMEDDFTAFAALASLGYWTINGLAIYAVIKLTQAFPQTADRLGRSWVWSAAGIVLTSAFYAILHGMRAADSWPDLWSYFDRLADL